MVRSAALEEWSSKLRLESTQQKQLPNEVWTSNQIETVVIPRTVGGNDGSAFTVIGKKRKVRKYKHRAIWAYDWRKIIFGQGELVAGDPALVPTVGVEYIDILSEA